MPLAATGLRVGVLEPVTAGRVKLAVAWSNSWRNARNHDAAWVFLKCRAARGSWQPGLLREGNAGPGAVVTIETSDQMAHPDRVPPGYDKGVPAGSGTSARVTVAT